MTQIKELILIGQCFKRMILKLLKSFLLWGNICYVKL